MSLALHIYFLLPDANTERFTKNELFASALCNDTDVLLLPLMLFFLFLFFPLSHVPASSLRKQARLN